MTLRLPLLVLLAALAASGCARDEVVSDYVDGPRVVTPGEPHPLAPRAGLSGVMTDGHIEPEWGCATHDGFNPDTLDAPRGRLADVLATPPPSPVNLAGTVTGFYLCSPCPAGAQCELCIPDQVELSAPLGSWGTVGARLFVSPGVTLCPLRIGQRVVATVEALPKVGRGTRDRGHRRPVTLPRRRVRCRPAGGRRPPARSSTRS